VSDALKAGVAAQLVVLDDASLTETGSSPSDVLGVPAEVITEQLTGDLLWEILIRGSRGGALFPLASQINHDATLLRARQIESALREVGREIRESFARLEGARSGEQRVAESLADAVLRIEQLLQGLELGDHEEGERRVHRLFLHLSRDQQRAAVEAIMNVATSTTDDVARLLACSLLEAADRLDPLLVKPAEVGASPGHRFLSAQQRGHADVAAGRVRSWPSAGLVAGKTHPAQHRGLVCARGRQGWREAAPPASRSRPGDLRSNGSKL
jgi:hypothetical protein